MKYLSLTVLALLLSFVSFAIGPISGVTNICSGGTTTLTNASPGTWTSSNPLVASIDMNTGDVFGGIVATTSATVITFNDGVSAVTTTVSVSPARIVYTLSGGGGYCAGSGGVTLTLNGSESGVPYQLYTGSTPVGAPVPGTGSAITFGPVTGAGNYIAVADPMGCTTQMTGTPTVSINPLPDPYTISGSGSYCSGNPTGVVLYCLCAAPTQIIYQLYDPTGAAYGPAIPSTGGWISFPPVTTAGTYSVVALNTVTSCTSAMVGTPTVTVNPPPATTITGPSHVCVDNTITLQNAVTVGTWFGSNTSIATIDSASGVLTGISAGTATVTYSTGTGCQVTYSLTVDASVPITGATGVCVSNATQLSAALIGGIWSSSNTIVATVSSTGLVWGVSVGGPVTITYTPPVGCIATTSVIINPLPGAITASNSVCQGATITLSNITPGGAWSSSNVAVATIVLVGPYGVLTGGSTSGITTVTYALPTGCIQTKTVTVNMQPGTITGIKSMCDGGFTQLSNNFTGGAWSSSNILVATINATGNVLGIAVGISNITYTIGSCSAITTVTVNPQPSNIIGPGTICNYSTTALSSALAGGIWSSSNTNASVDAFGVVTGAAVGSATISYLMAPTGCFATKNMTINSGPLPIAGITSACIGTIIQLSSAPGGGTWSVGSPSSATVSVNATGIVTGIAPGTGIVTYTVGSCSATTSVTFNPFPTAISGTFYLCQSSTTLLSNADAGGTWSSASISIASVGINTGVVTGNNLGTTNITYTLPTGCFRSQSVTVIANPAPITGQTDVCEYAAATYASLTSGGAWSSSFPAIATINTASGYLNGLTPGVTTITYTLGTGCSTAKTVTVNPTPLIFSPSAICNNTSVTLSSNTSGGIWSSSNSVIATINPSSGVIMGVSAGIVTVSYTLGSCSATASLTVNPIPSAIVGPTNICLADIATMNNATPGGLWTSANPLVADINGATGVVSSLSIGTAIISYTMSGGCNSTHTVTVSPLPSNIFGPSSVCSGSSVTLSSSPSGGTWTSSNTGSATISPAGLTQGVSSGTTNISYILSTGCGTAMSFTVNPLPSPITGPSSACTGSSIVLTASPAGTWSSSSPAIATVDSITGVASGLSSGTVTISYSLVSGCGSVATPVTVSPPPIVTITASPGDTVCSGTVVTYNATISGGTPLYYSWLLNGASTAGSGATYSYTPSSGDVITGVVSNISSCNSTTVTTVSNSITMSVDATPTVIATASPSSCGGNYTLSASGAGIYSWSPSAGLACSTCAITSAYPSSTNYTVTGTTAAGCTDVATVSANANRIAGHIAYGGVATDSFRVWLISYNPSDSTVTALDSTTSCMDAGTPYYEFLSPAAGTYKVKAKLFGGAPGTSGYIPTYGLSSATWNSGATINHITAADSQHINMIYGTVPPGSGFISGNVYSGAGRGTLGEVPVEGMIIYLKNTATSVLTYTYTDATGSYRFINIAYADYVIYPEEFSYYTTPSAVISLSATSTFMTGINFKQHTESGTITPYDPTGIKTMVNEAGIGVFPNPTANTITLQWKDRVPDIANVTITDVTGRILYKTHVNMKTSNGTEKIDLSSFSNGLYMICVKSATINYNSKVQVQH